MPAESQRLVLSLVGAGAVGGAVAEVELPPVVGRVGGPDEERLAPVARALDVALQSVDAGDRVVAGGLPGRVLAWLMPRMSATVAA